MGIAAATAVVAGLIAVWFLIVVPGMETEDISVPDPAPTATAAPIDPSVPAVDKIGQAAGGGSFDPLAVPSGISTGAGVDIPDSQLTGPDADLVAATGTIALVEAQQVDTMVSPIILAVVDDVSAPLTDAARDAAFAEAGQEQWDGRIVQKVTMRIRHIAGDAAAENWDIYRSVLPVNGALEGMVVAPASGPDCTDSRTPFTEHGLTTDDTVQVCFYAIGAVSRPADPVSSIAITTLYDNAETRVYFQSNWNPIKDPGHSHEGDGEAADDHSHG